MVEPVINPYPSPSPFHEIDGTDFASTEEMASQLYGWLRSQAVVNEGSAQSRLREAEDAREQADLHLARAAKYSALAESIKPLTNYAKDVG